MSEFVGYFPPPKEPVRRDVELPQWDVLSMEQMAKAREKLGDEEFDLFYTVRTESDRTRRIRARNILVERYIPFGVFLLKNNLERLGGRMNEDLRQTMAMTLVKAIDSFDLAEGVTFRHFYQSSWFLQIKNIGDRGTLVPIDYRVLGRAQEYLALQREGLNGDQAVDELINRYGKKAKALSAQDAASVMRYRVQSLTPDRTDEDERRRFVSLEADVTAAHPYKNPEDILADDREYEEFQSDAKKLILFIQTKLGFTEKQLFVFSRRSMLSFLFGEKIYTLDEIAEEMAEDGQPPKSHQSIDSKIKDYTKKLEASVTVQAFCKKYNISIKQIASIPPSDMR